MLTYNGCPGLRHWRRAILRHTASVTGISILTLGIYNMEEFDLKLYFSVLFLLSDLLISFSVCLKTTYVNKAGVRLHVYKGTRYVCRAVPVYDPRNLD